MTLYWATCIPTGCRLDTVGIDVVLLVDTFWDLILEFGMIGTQSLRVHVILNMM